VIRCMTGDDLNDALRLTRVAGWNQLENDWQFFLRESLEGCFVAEEDGCVVGTTTTIVYETRLAWVAMVLVDPSFRRRGIGTALLNAALQSTASCECVKLDATPAGKTVYDGLGFVDELPLVRMTLDKPLPAGQVPGLRPMRETDLSQVMALDAACVGAERAALLTHLFETAREYAWVAEDDAGTVRGFALGRHGHTAEYVGPIVADDEETAWALLATVTRQGADRPWIIDVLSEKVAWCERLREAGFREQRPLIRMYKGPALPPSAPTSLFAIAGPEFG